jgi:hypothetical protein
MWCAATWSIGISAITNCNKRKTNAQSANADLPISLAVNPAIMGCKLGCLFMQFELVKMNMFLLNK